MADEFNISDAGRRLEDSLERLRGFRSHIDRLIDAYRGHAPDSEARERDIRFRIREELYRIEQDMDQFRNSMK